MSAIFSIEDVFSIPRGTVITGRVISGVVENGDVIVSTLKHVSVMIPIIGIEKFRKAFNTRANVGDNIGLLIDYSKDEMTKLRGENLVIENISYLRDYKLTELGI